MWVNGVMLFSSVLLKMVTYCTVMCVCVLCTNHIGYTMGAVLWRSAISRYLQCLHTFYFRQPFNYLVVNGSSEHCQAMNAKLFDRAVELGWRALVEGEEGEGQCQAEENAVVPSSTRTGLPLAGSGFARRLHPKWYVGMSVGLTYVCMHTQ